MRKYWLIAKNEIQRQFTHRANIIAYGFGNIAELLILVVIWTAVFKNADVIRGYTKVEMISYVIFAWFFAYLTTNYSFEQNIAADIHSGTLSNFLVKPLSYIRYVIAVITGRIILALFVVIFEGFLVIYFFRQDLLLSSRIENIILLAAMLVVTYFINLLIAILIGFIGFWTTEIAGVQYSIKIFIKLLSGVFFPLNLLPAFFAKISLLSPFAYTVYIPVQLYLGKISFAEGLRGLAIEIIWLVILYVIIKVVWRLGLKKYESVGI